MSRICLCKEERLDRTFQVLNSDNRPSISILGDLALDASNETADSDGGLLRK